MTKESESLQLYMKLINVFYLLEGILIGKLRFAGIMPHY